MLATIDLNYKKTQLQEKSMALFDAYKKKSAYKAAMNKITEARNEEGSKADQLFATAYEGFSEVVEGDVQRGEALYNWGFGLLHQAKDKPEEESVKLFLSAISKFTFCLLVSPNHLGAAIDGGVAYMDLARIMGVEPSDELYDLAGEFFENAERIQRGSAAYNLACIYSLRGQPDACSKALELSRESGSLPEIDDIQGDDDLNNVKQSAWFVEFVEKAQAAPEIEPVDESQPQYDVEGNLVNKNKKKKQYENVVDGVAYDAEGNVIRTLEENSEQPQAVEAAAPEPVEEKPETAEVEQLTADSEEEKKPAE